MRIYLMILKSIFLYIANLDFAIKMQYDGCGSLSVQKLNIYFSVSIIPAIKCISIKFSQYLGLD